MSKRQGQRPRTRDGANALAVVHEKIEHIYHELDRQVSAWGSFKQKSTRFAQRFGN